MEWNQIPYFSKNGVSNIIGTGYSTTIIKGEYSWYTGSYSSVPTVLCLDNGDTITNPYDTANTFNNYFASIAEPTKKHKIFK